MKPRMALGDFLVAYLQRIGVTHLFGIPGDLVMRLFLRFGQKRGLQIVTMSHEPGVGFAADGYARATGRIGVVCVTYGAGGHNMVNPVAGSFSERVPILVISGGPGEEERRLGTLIHHQAKEVESQLHIYRELRQAGNDGVGIVIQSYLRRAIGDVRDLRDLAPRVRLVKGIYVEPAAVAYQDPTQINRSYVDLLEELIDGGSHVAVATHDESLITAAQRIARERGLSRDGYEFQLLLGVKEHLRDRLIGSGERVRIYVPFGEAWYGYSVRRLKENPSIAGYVAQDVARRLVGR